MNQLVKSLREVRSQYVREDYIENAKAVIQKHLEALEPDADIEDTKYFNHSAIPDFKLSWKGASGKKSTRDFFFRSSYAAVISSHDIEHIRSGDPVFVAIDPSQSVTEQGFEMHPDDVRSAVTSADSDSTLLTDVSAVDEISRNPEKESSPLRTIVRANFLRGAKGLVDEPVAEVLVNADASNADGSIIDLVRQSFLSDAVFRMERTAALMDWALQASDPQANADALDSELLAGTMSEEELRAFLPWLLGLEKAPTSEDFWGRLGSMFDFAQLESLADILEGLDISPLVAANLSNWAAKRSFLGLNTPIEGMDSRTDPHWMFRNGRLGLSVGENRISVSNSGYKLQARSSSVSPKWAAVAPKLAGFSTQAVSLRGIERSFHISSQKFNSINDDVKAVVESVSDEYFVEDVEVTVPGDEDSAIAKIDFSGGIVIASEGAELATMARLAANVIGSVGLDENLDLPEEFDGSSQELGPQ